MHLDSGGPRLSTEVPFQASSIFYLHVDWLHPPSLSFADSVTFSLAGIVGLHEVAGAAAEVATLRVVAELRAGAEAQALVDVWG